MKSIKKFTFWFSRQRRSGRIFLVIMGLLLVIFMGTWVFSVFTASEPLPEPQLPSITPAFKATSNVALKTWTPTPTNLPILTGTPTPIRTSLPTGLPTQSLDTATAVTLPTGPPPVNGNVLVVIAGVDKQLEYVDIQNAGDSPISLSGWVLVSETGNQICQLKGILQAKEVLRIWADTGQVGLSCGFKNRIWLDEELDPAVLYNVKKEEVSRYP